MGLGGLGFCFTGGGGFGFTDVAAGDFFFFADDPVAGFFVLLDAEAGGEEDGGGCADDCACDGDVAKAKSSPQDTPQPAPLSHPRQVSPHYQPFPGTPSRSSSSRLECRDRTLPGSAKHK